MSLSNAKMLMQDLAKSLGTEGDVLGDDGLCSITVGEKWIPPVHICYLDPDNSMLFFAEIGLLTADRELEILRELMHRQYLFSGTNGVTTSLSGDRNVLTVQFKFSLADLTAQDLEQHLNDFVGEVARVKILVCGKKPEDEASGSDSTGEMDPVLRGQALDI